MKFNKSYCKGSSKILHARGAQVPSRMDKPAKQQSTVIEVSASPPATARDSSPGVATAPHTTSRVLDQTPARRELPITDVLTQKFASLSKHSTGERAEKQIRVPGKIMQKTVVDKAALPHSPAMNSLQVGNPICPSQSAIETAAGSEILPLEDTKEKIVCRKV